MGFLKYDSLGLNGVSSASLEWLISSKEVEYIFYGTRGSGY